MTFDDIKRDYKPKEGFTIVAKVSEHTGRYVAAVFRKDIVNRRRSEFNDSSVGNISTLNIEDYFKFLKPYVERRDTGNNQEV